MRFWRRREETTEAFSDDAERLPSSEAALVEAPPAEPPPEPEPAQQSAEERQGWFSRLRAGMARSSARLTEGINTIFTRRRLDDEALFELEELLISSDMGTGVAGEVAETLRKTRFNQEVSPEEVRGALAEQVIRLVEPVMKPLRLDLTKKPFVILVVGVNGSGKTTTIAKLAKQYRDDGHKVVLAAGDTFRAAAIEQLGLWAERVGAELVKHQHGADPSAVTYDGVQAALARGMDTVIIDTAGRLHVKANLMEEVKKIARTTARLVDRAPHQVLLVIDATTGQNAVTQARAFHEALGVTAVVLTKLDGTAKGGVALAIRSELGLPIRYVGLGEQADDLAPFDADAFAAALFAEDGITDAA